jgi:hypothetical protein
LAWIHVVTSGKIGPGTNNGVLAVALVWATGKLNSLWPRCATSEKVTIQNQFGSEPFVVSKQVFPLSERLRIDRAVTVKVVDMPSLLQKALRLCQPK